MSENTTSGLFQKFKQKFEYIVKKTISRQWGKYPEFLNIFINLFRITGENVIKNCFFCKFKLIKHVSMNLIFYLLIFILFFCIGNNYKKRVPYFFFRGKRKLINLPNEIKFKLDYLFEAKLVRKI